MLLYNINMTGKTHFSTSMLAGEAYALSVGSKDPVIGIATGIGGLLPDIDTKHSTISVLIIRNLFIIVVFLAIIFFNTVPKNFSAIYVIRMIPLLSFLIAGAVSKHRTFTHSLIGLMLFAFGLWLISFNVPEIKNYTAFVVIGYVIHLAEDAMTVSGIPLLYPFKKKCYKIKFKKIKIKTNGTFDNAIGTIAFLFIIVLYYYQFSGTVPFISKLIHK